MSEMRKPADFWKGMICAQAVIYTCYVTFGMVVYSYQGQFSFNPAMQSLSPYNFQTAVNIIFLFSGLIAACLYGNIGVKVSTLTSWMRYSTRQHYKKEKEVALGSLDPNLLVDCIHHLRCNSTVLIPLWPR